MSMFRARRLTVVPCGTVPRSPGGEAWDARVAREVRHQSRIEAAFDRVDACERLGDFRHALGWLDRADELSGGLSPAYRATRTQYAEKLARQRKPKLGSP